MKRSQLNKNHNNRQGWSLIEMTLMITLLGSFSLVAISLLTTLMDMDTSIATASAFELTAERLEDQLRKDAQATVQTEMTENEVKLITQQGQTIQYRVTEGKVQRSMGGDRQTSQETFAFIESSVSLIVSGETIELTIRKASSLGEKNRASLLGTREGASVRALIPLGRALRFVSSTNSNGEGTKK